MVKSNQTRALWPYLIVLGLLFVLSLAAPRSWDRTKPTVATTTDSQPAVPHPPRVRPIVLLAREESPRDVAPTLPAIELRNAPLTEKIAEQYLPPVGRPGPIVDPPTVQIGETELNPRDERLAAAERRWRETRALVTESWEHARNGLGQLTQPIAGTLDPEILAKLLVTRNRNTHGENGGHPAIAPAVGPSEVRVEDMSENWPRAEELIAACEALRGNQYTQLWANQTLALLDALSRRSLHDPNTKELLTELRRVAYYGGVTAEKLTDGTDESVRLRRAQYDLVRRLELWDVLAARSYEHGPFATCIVPTSGLDPLVVEPTRALEAYLATQPAGANWAGYLQVDAIEQLALAEDPTAPRLAVRPIGLENGRQSTSHIALDRRTSALRILARANNPRLTAEQRAFLTRPELSRYLRALEGWTIQTRLLVDVVQTIENFERSRLPTDAHALGRLICELSLSADERDARLAKTLDLHYRNANVRMVVTGTLLNRFIPPQQPSNGIVNERIAGVPAQGRSTTMNDVHLKMLPHNNAWGVQFDVAGSIESHTSSKAGPVTFISQGMSTYTAEKGVYVTADGIRAMPATAHADSRSTLAGMRTEYDNIPLAGNLVRNIALQKHEEAKAGAQSEVSRKVAYQARDRVDSEINARLGVVEDKIRTNVVERLRKLNLDPTVVALQTTEDRVTGRFRLSDADQLGAHTARPQAPSESLSNMQLHESTLNNLMSNLDLARETWTVAALHEHLAAKMGNAPQKLSADLPTDVTILFAEDDPLSIHFQDGRIVLSIAIAELTQKDRVWENIELEVAYRFEVDGLQLSLRRDGNVSLGGEHKGRADVMLRAIAGKVFPRENTIKLIPQTVIDDRRLDGLVWSQVQLENGWLGLCLADAGELARRSVLKTQIR